MHYILKNKQICLSLICFFVSTLLSPQKIETTLNHETGAISRIYINNDVRNMNWILATDGSQYKWIGKEYGWGLGYFTLVTNQDSIQQIWNTPTSIVQKGDRTTVTYVIGDIRLSVARYPQKDDFIEEYTFSNTGNKKYWLKEIGINTPFNDNYPDAATCNTSRTNAHIWPGENAAYVNATHMSGYPPNLGLVLITGSVKSYEIKERSRENSNSDARGVIILNPENILLEPGKSNMLSWRIFSHKGYSDFLDKALVAGSIVASSDKYVYEIGDTAHVIFKSNVLLNNTQVRKNGTPIAFIKKERSIFINDLITTKGEMTYELHYGNDKKTHVSCLAISSEKGLLERRAQFIINHQQMNKLEDKRNGAYMVYDNEKNEIFLNDQSSVSPQDRDEGAERLGMGVFLALQYQLTKDELIKESLLKYARFIRNKLQDENYNTWSMVGHIGRNRGYNYPWVANFYFEMFKVTGDRQFLKDGYGTLRAMYRNFGFGFYAIDYSVQKSLSRLRENNLKTEADSLLINFRKTGEIFLKNGCNYPKHEVNFEQSISAPSVMLLCELYLVTGEKKYLEGAKIQMPLLEAFAGLQPSYHLNEIAIRHWDAYWFGKREMWGDTFTHYWSTLNGYAYSLYAKCTNNRSYQKRAENIVRNNLSLFFEDGKASCAYVYPYKVNDRFAQFYDPFANDQDWALVYYLMVNKKD